MRGEQRGSSGRSRLRFGPFELDGRNLRLFRDGRALALQPQPARVLRALVEAEGDVVSRQELQEVLWGERHVEAEVGLNQCIRRIRAVLGDRAEAPVYIETVRGEGYRLAAPVTLAESPSSVRGSRTVGRFLSAHWTGFAALLITASVVIGARDSLGPTSTERSVASSSGRVELPAETRRGPDTPEMPPAAWEAFAEARQARLSGEADDVDSLLPRLRRAVALYPAFAPAWVELARAELRRKAPGAGRGERAAEALEKALAVDPELGEAHLLRADLAFFREWDWEKARHHYLEAVRYSPSQADAHKGLAFWLSSHGRFDEAVVRVRRALELDPVSVRLEADLGFFLMRAGRSEEAIEPCRRAVDLDPEGRPGHTCLVEASALLPERGPPPVASIEYLMRRAGADAQAFDDVLVGEPATLYERFWAWSLAEQLREAEAGMPRSIALARAHAQLGQADEAITWLEEAEQERSWFLPFIAIDPWLRRLRGRERYDRMLGRLGLESPWLPESTAPARPQPR